MSQPSTRKRFDTKRAIGIVALLRLIEEQLRKLAKLANLHDVDAIQELLKDEMRFTNPITGSSDKDGMRSIHSMLFKAFPDIHYSLERMIASGHTYVMECVLTGTHQNDLMDIPATNKRIELPAAFVVDMERGRVAQWNSYFDVATLMRQLGVG
jgi:steroid delta-isomerase-like uncharacterized protein